MDAQARWGGGCPPVWDNLRDCNLSDLGRLIWKSPDLVACASLKAVTVPFQFPEVVPLNIGGTHFTTRLSTLRRYEDTMLAAMFSGRHYIPTDSEGRYFIDRDGTHFGYVCLAFPLQSAQ